MERQPSSTNGQLFNVNGNGNTTTYTPDYSTTDNRRVYGSGSIFVPEPISPPPNFSNHIHRPIGVPPQNTGPPPTIEHLERRIHALQEQLRVANCTPPLEPQDAASARLQLHPQHYPHQTVAYQQQAPVVGPYGTQTQLPSGQYPLGLATGVVYPAQVQHSQPLPQEHYLSSTPLLSPSLQPSFTGGVTPFNTTQMPLTQYAPQTPGAPNFLTVPSYSAASSVGHSSVGGTPVSRTISVSSVPSVATTGEATGPALQVVQPLGTMMHPQGTPIVPNYVYLSTPQAQPIVAQPFTPATTTTTLLQNAEVPQVSEDSDKLGSIPAAKEKKQGLWIVRLPKKLFRKKKKVNGQ